MKRKTMAAARSLWDRMRAGRIPSSETEPFLQRLLQNLPGMAYRCRDDPSWTMEFVSSGCRALTGFTPEDLVDNRVVSYARLVHPDDRDRVWRTVRRSVDHDQPFRVTYRIRTADGATRWVWEQGVGVRGPDGGIEAIEGFITDITDRYELTERISTHESRYRALVEQSLVGVYVIREGRFLYVNPHFAEIFGYTVAQILELDSVEALVHPDDRARVAENLRRRLDGDVDELHYDFRGVRRDGTPCEVEVHGRRVGWDGGPAVIGVVLDVTARERARRFYHGAKKMEALGQLAAGVAHDFNNILAVIKTTAHLMKPTAELATADGYEQWEADVAEISAAVDRAAALCHQLIAFGRERRTPHSALSLPQLIEELIPILVRILGDTVRLDVLIEDDLPPVLLEAAPAEEVVMNLALNAKDAMPEGGTMLIRATTLAGTNPGTGAGRDSGTAPGAGTGTADHHPAHVLLEVTDTGSGIPDEIRRHIFEPYFTTKADEGTGLGLANVWRICQDAGGWVEVESEPGVGTTFRACFPSASPDDLEHPAST